MNVFKFPEKLCLDKYMSKAPIDNSKYFVPLSTPLSTNNNYELMCMVLKNQDPVLEVIKSEIKQET
jgi:hypothetical protein